MIDKTDWLILKVGMPQMMVLYVTFATGLDTVGRDNRK